MLPKLKGKLTERWGRKASGLIGPTLWQRGCPEHISGALPLYDKFYLAKDSIMMFPLAAVLAVSLICYLKSQRKVLNGAAISNKASTSRSS
jgi:hypothetical protein